MQKYLQFSLEVEGKVVYNGMHNVSDGMIPTHAPGVIRYELRRDA